MNNKYIFEVGGKGKDVKRIKDLKKILRILEKLLVRRLREEKRVRKPPDE
ncbi:MAG: hypothetical protein IIA88_07060 [Bacteroidetes bacterium]|nr:hypothetical protein [Bacteroidota bacterium]